jgi:hypothetical protein
MPALPPEIVELIPANLIIQEKPVLVIPVGRDYSQAHMLFATNSTQMTREQPAATETDRYRTVRTISRPPPGQQDLPRPEHQALLRQEHLQLAGRHPGRRSAQSHRLH